MSLKTFEDLRYLATFQERFEYLKLASGVGVATFGFDRYINQAFYKSPAWRSVRDVVILRDNGCDLGIPGHEIRDRILVHHMNPISQTDIDNLRPIVLNPNYLITTRHSTHTRIHFGDSRQIKDTFEERKPNDTKLW